MKKIIRNTLLIFLAIFILEIIVFIFKDNHKVEYKIVNDKTFNVTEVYNKGNYYFNVNIDNNKFYFDYKNSSYKTKKVLKDVLYYEKKDLKCIFPVLKNEETINIFCLKDDTLYTYDYFKDDLHEFVDVISSKDYDVKNFSDDASYKKFDKATVYINNILEDTYIYIWKYNGFYSLNKKETNQVNLFSNDIYSNNLGINVSKYYVIPNYDEKYEYSKFYVINMTNDKIKELKLKKKKTITNDYYINGIVDDKLYIFDVDNSVQYKINPKRLKITEVGNKKDGGLFYDGTSFENLNIYNFKEEQLIFKENIKIPEEIKGYDEIFITGENIYYTLNNDFIYYNKTLNKNIYLFNMEDISNITLVDNTLYFIKGDALYYYDIYHGLKKIISYDELLFNKTNRYVVYKK